MMNRSLEDRIVKRAFLCASGRPVEDKGAPPLLRTPEPPPARVSLLTKKPVTASDEEQSLNTRSRSAKLRFVEKL